MAKRKSLVDEVCKDLGILRAPKGRAQERRRAELLHRGLRWGVQLVFLALFPGVWSAAFSGVKYVCQQVGALDTLEISGFLTLLVALLLYTCLFGRFFCGYACSFGFLGDAVFALAAPLRRALGVDGKKLPIKARYLLHQAKYFVLLGICALCFVGTWPSVSGFSPWGAFAGLRAGSVEGISAVAFAVLGAIVVGMAFEERFFCQFLCPLGAVFTQLPVLPVALFRRRRETCAPRCNRCQDRCPVGIHPERYGLRSGECIACGRCADGCPVANVSLVRVEQAVAEKVGATGAEEAAGPAADKAARTGARPAEPRFCIRGTEVTLVLLKAASLLALCYAFA